MAIEQREITIGGTTYRVTQLGTKKGQALLVRLVKLLGPGLGSFASGLGRADGEGFDVAMAVGVGDALHDLSMRLNETEVAGVLEEFAKITVIVHSEDLQPTLWSVYDDHFAGRYDELLRWARFCMEVNYRSFFSAQSGGDGKPLQRLWKVLQSLQSRAESPGTSTASPAAAATRAA